jgi:predicted nucleotidyltransferase
MNTQNISIPPSEIIAFCQRYPIRKLALFGSVLREDFRPDSDIDVLVEFEPNATIDYFDMAMMEIELSQIVGRKVDLRTPNELSRYFRQKVVDTALVLYERR